MMTANGLAKLLEEMGELSQVTAKRLAYFKPGAEHPDGAGALDQRMEDEMADVIAAIVFVANKFDLSAPRIQARIAAKVAKFEQWDAVPDNAAESFHG